MSGQQINCQNQNKILLHHLLKSIVYMFKIVNKELKPKTRILILTTNHCQPRRVTSPYSFDAWRHPMMFTSFYS